MAKTYTDTAEIVIRIISIQSNLVYLSPLSQTNI